MCDFKRSETGMKFIMEIISKQDIDKYNREDYKRFYEKDLFC